MSTPSVFTIGHSTHSIEVFLDLLHGHGVTAIADVRSSPYSRFNPQFERKALEASLRAAGIHYVFLGRELGARSDDETCYDQGRVVYGRLAQSAAFKEGIARVVRGAAEHRIALLCAEKEPLECHRTILVAPALVKAGLEVVHIHADGRLESHPAAMTRLLEILGMTQRPLFGQSDLDPEAEALLRQERRIAYIDPQHSTGAAGGGP